MDPYNRLDDRNNQIITALLHDVINAHGLVFNTRDLKLTFRKVSNRLRAEGIGFLTKTLPRLGKAFDKALAGDTPLNATKLGFASMQGSELPKLFGELFKNVLQPNGELLQHPCANSVKAIRQLCFVFYKYKLPFTDEQTQTVIDRFTKTEEDLCTLHPSFKDLEARVANSYQAGARRDRTDRQTEVTRRAKTLLKRLFAHFDPKDIYPRHGPGTVATKQKLWGKYCWTNVSARITDMYPFDAYFCASAGHVCDSYDTFSGIKELDLPARVILVPKDSRGPRLISCEPVDFQWIQQGLGRAIVQLVERHPLTRENVRFTDQSPNQIGALSGSENGRYATLDLNEASDRVSVDLVHLLFPEDVYTYLEACRSSSTELPNGEVLKLQKFAPMGSCLCFPVLALTVWAILAAAAPDAYTRERIYVYGDDVIVPTAFAVDAMEQLESFGLKINRDKSCISGLFRESCGMDAFNGVNVTPVRFRTVWSSTPSPSSYSSWIAYANACYDRKYFYTYDLIVKELLSLYGPIASKDMRLACPSLYEVPDCSKPKRRRFNKNLQKFEYYVTDIKSPVINKEIDGWSMLLRYFAEKGVGFSDESLAGLNTRECLDLCQDPDEGLEAPFSVRSYTNRRTGLLVRRWR